VTSREWWYRKGSDEKMGSNGQRSGLVPGRLQEGNRWRCSLVCCAAGIVGMGRGESEEDGWTSMMNAGKRG
jgi:hypothetical protein